MKLRRAAVIECDASRVGVARLSFASEHPVLRKDKGGEYYEVLSHAPGDVNLRQLNTQGLVLEDHDEAIEIGSIERDSAKVDADKKTRATINVTDNFWQNQIKTNAEKIPVSVGYSRLSVIRAEPGKDGNPETRYYTWKPYEVSLLTVRAADDSVGINRAKNKRRCAECEGSGRCRCRSRDEDDADEDCEDCDGDGDCPDCDGNGYFESARSRQVDSSHKKKTKNNFMADKPEIIEADVRKDERTKATADVQTAERARAKDISARADAFITQHGRKAEGKAEGEIRKRANEAIEKGTSASEFSSSVMEYILTAGPEIVDIREKVPAEDLMEFSLVRCIQQAYNNRKKGSAGMPDEKSVEGQVIKTFSDECRKAEGGMGFEPEGFVIPPHVNFGSHTLSRQEKRSMFRKLQNQFGRNFTRDMQVDVFGAGGAVVPTFWLLPVIELLLNKMVLPRVGVRTMAGLTGNVIIPRLEAPTTAYSLAEKDAITASQLTLGQVSMKPHRVGNRVIYTKQLVFQSSPDIEALIRDNMFSMLALKGDALGLFGQGAGNEPLGIMNTPGIGTVTFGATPTYIKMVLFETIIRKLNVMGKLGYVSTSATKGSLKTVAEALTGATTIGGAQNAIWKGVGGDGEGDGEVNGYPAVDSQQIPNDQVLCGAWDQFIHGIFGGFDTVVDLYTLAANAEIAVNMNLWLDFVSRHPQGFAVSTDSGAQ